LHGSLLLPLRLSARVIDQSRLSTNAFPQSANQELAVLGKSMGSYLESSRPRFIVTPQ
jgi:hypothetical protein